MNNLEENNKIAANIQEYGWHCLHVFPTTDEHEQFSYTIGFTESFGAPEIMLFGLNREKSHALLNECAQLLRGGHKFCADVKDGSVLSGSYNIVLKPVKVQYFNEYLGTAVRYFETKPFEAMVMFLPDKNNLFPWEHAYIGQAADEPLKIV